MTKRVWVVLAVLFGFYLGHVAMPSNLVIHPICPDTASNLHR